MPSLLNPTPERRRSPARWPAAVALALVVHAAMVGLLLLSSGGAAPPPRSVAVRTISARDWAANRGQQPPRSAQREDAPKPPPETKPEGQVVDVAPGNRQRPEDADYLAESNNKVEKQTRAKDQAAIAPRVTRQRTSPTPSQTEGQDEVAAAESAGNGGTGRDTAAAAEAGRKAARAEVPTARRVEPLTARPPEAEGEGPRVARRSERFATEGSAERLRLQEGEADGSSAASDGAAGAAGGRLNLMPPASVLGSSAGATRPDHLPDVEEGAQTLLNTVMWKHAGFMNRIRSQVYGRWTRNLDAELALRDPTLTIYLGRDRYTLLLVAMNAAGEVQDIDVARSSGVDFLDQAAVQAFYSAQPFPSPPPQLAREDGMFIIPFGFTVHRGNNGIVIRSGAPPVRRGR